MLKVEFQSSNVPGTFKDCTAASKLEANGGVAFMYMLVARVPVARKSELFEAFISSISAVQDPVEGISFIRPGIEAAGSSGTGSSGAGSNAADVNTGSLEEMGAGE